MSFSKTLIPYLPVSAFPITRRTPIRNREGLIVLKSISDVVSRVYCLQHAMMFFCEESKIYGKCN